MRLGLGWTLIANANYRAIEPLKAMARRGHEVVWPSGPHGEVDFRRLAGCDVVHVYRRCDPYTLRVLSELARRGTAITYDNDDDFASVPEQSPAYAEFGGLHGKRRFQATLEAARLAQALTTTNELLAERYRNAGVKRVEVLPNSLATDAQDPLTRPDGLQVSWLTRGAELRPRIQHDGTVIGWIAGLEHQLDAEQLGIAECLRQLVARHRNIRVECIGVDLDLPERYRHDADVAFNDLPARIGGFDIGIAPLADIPWNRARSDVKLKEYAASGVPWLASPVGPYVSLGEQQGGRLVHDDGWFDALDRLIRTPGERQALGVAGKAWARTQTIEVVADRWERLFLDVAPSPADEKLVRNG
jgi:glycosyltransferase involved in cell wall biosynthesis